MKFSGLYVAFVFSILPIYSTVISIKDESKNSTQKEFKFIVHEFNDSVNYINRKHSIKRRLIVPGSLWCGVGTVAIKDDDIGQFYKTDSCCRDRDLCGVRHKEILLHFEAKPETTTKLFGKPVCKCEREFYRCLRKANTILSRNLGRVYFSVIRPTCYTYDHPSLYCIKFQGVLQRRCLQYQVDTNQRMRVEIRDNPLFL